MVYFQVSNLPTGGISWAISGTCGSKYSIDEASGTGSRYFSAPSRPCRASMFRMFWADECSSSSNAYRLGSTSPFWGRRRETTETRGHLYCLILSPLLMVLYPHLTPISHHLVILTLITSKYTSHLGKYRLLTFKAPSAVSQNGEHGNPQQCQ